MNRTVFAAAAILLATGSAFAGSDHFSVAAQQVVAVDTTTASIAKPEMARHDMAAKFAVEEPGRGIWGH